MRHSVICFYLLVVFTPSVKVENGIVVADFLQGRLVESRENADFENYRKIPPTQLSVGHSGKYDNSKERACEIWI